MQVGPQDGNGTILMIESKGLSLPDFARSLKNITNNGKRKMDVIFTSCCMSAIELAYEIHPYVSYLVTTQEHIAGYDFIERYYKPIWELKNNSHLDPGRFVRLAVNIYKTITFEYFTSYGYKISPLNKLLDKLPFPQLHTGLNEFIHSCNKLEQGCIFSR